MYRNVGESDNESPWHGAIAWLMNRYMPYHAAYTFVLARQDEYEADRTASNLAGAEASANGLVRGTLLGSWFYESFWPTLYRQAETRERPAFMPYQAMHTAFKMSYPDWATEARLKQAWKKESAADDTHPCLRDRVEALGLTARLPRPLTANAASALLGASAKALVDEFDRNWWQRESREWGARHRQVSRSRERLGELAGRPLRSLPLHELQELAMLQVEVESPQAARPALEYLLRQSGGPFPKAELTYGRILVDAGDARGLDYLRSAARNDRRLSDEALHSGYHFLFDTRGEDPAQAWVNETLQAA